MIRAILLFVVVVTALLFGMDAKHTAGIKKLKNELADLSTQCSKAIERERETNAAQQEVIQLQSFILKLNDSTIERQYEVIIELQDKRSRYNSL